jgi:hypothetical protein
MIEGNEYYEMISRDPVSWLDISEKLKFSSEVIHEKLLGLIKIYKDDHNYNDEGNIVALWYSYYLLIGYSFENLIKGLSVENNSTIDDFDDIIKKWNYNSGHGITRIAQDNISDLTQNEISLLQKLETYIVWAGKYNLPKNVNKYNVERSRHFYNSKDYDTITALYDKIRNILLGHPEHKSEK